MPVAAVPATLLSLGLLLLCGGAVSPAGALAPSEGYGPGEFGSLTLCPPGGRAFMMAWSLACEMKRKRKKRSAQPSSEATKAPDTSPAKRGDSADYRPATLTEIQKICCDVGCELRDLLAYCDPFGPWNSK